MRKFIFALVLLLGVLFIIWKIAEVQDIVETSQRGDWRYLALALGAQSAWLFTVALSYRSIFRALGLDEKVKNLLAIAAAATFLNIVTPTVGMSGMAVFISEAHRRNYSPGRAAVAGAVYLLLDYAAFICVLTLGLFVLIRRDNLNIGAITASVLLVALFVLLSILIYLGTRSGERLGRALAWMAQQVNRILWPFLRRQYLSEERAYDFANDASLGIKIFVGSPKKLIAPSLLAIAKQFLLMLVLFLCFLAFKVAVSPGTIVASFSIGYLFLIISPTPAGLGVVEGMLTLALRSMYVPVGAAAVVTLAYRGFTFWIPFLVGMASLRWLGKAKDIRPAGRKEFIGE